jgi:hypothetical protein
LTRAEGPDVVPREALKRLLDPKESTVVRLAAIKLLQQKQFLSSIAADWRPDFVEGLRAASRQPALRRAALEVLSLLKDRPTQELLLRGVRQPRRALVPLHEALRLLSTDIHADVIDAARKLIDTPRVRKNHAAFVQALRVLAGDPGSIDKLQEVLASPAYPLEARRVAATGISHLSPERGKAAAQAMRAGHAEGVRRTKKRAAAAKASAKSKEALAKHLETLQKVRG